MECSCVCVCVSKWCRQCSCRPARSVGACLSSNSKFPPSWFVEYSLLDYLFCIFVSRSLARPAHSLLAHTGCDPFLLAASPPHLTGSLSSSKVAMPARYVAASDGEGDRIGPGKLVENIISTVPPSGDTSLAAIAQPLGPLVGYTINLCQHTNTIKTHPKTPAMPKTMHTPYFHTRW